MKLLPIPMLQVRRAAHILGSASVAAKALSEFERRVAQGEDVRFFQDVRTKAIIIGPHPSLRAKSERATEKQRTP